MWGQLSSRQYIAGNLASLKVIEVKRARVRKLVFQKMLDRIGGPVLYKTIRAMVMSRTLRNKFQ